MRLPLLLTMILLLQTFPTGALAELPGHPAIHVGVSRSWFDYDGALEVWRDEGGRTTPTIGVDFQLHFGETLLLQPGLRYASVGSQISFEVLDFGEPIRGAFTHQFDYLTLPVLLRMQNETGRGLFGVFGPEIQFLLRAKTPCDDDADQRTCPEDDDVKDFVHRLNTAIVFGVGWAWNVSDQIAELELRYAIGQDGVAKGDWVADWNTREVFTTVGVRF